MARKPSQIPNVEVAPSYLMGTIASLLDHIVKENARSQMVAPTADCLFSTPWKYDWVAITDYLDRLKEWIVCGIESFVVATCYFKRLEEVGALPTINNVSVHRIFFTCLMLAVKMTEDETLNNADFAKVACIQLKDLNAMEVFVLCSLNFECAMPVEEFVNTKRQLIHLDLLLTKAKNGKCDDLSKLGRTLDPSATLTISSVCGELAGITPKRYFAAAIPVLKEQRRCSSNFSPSAAAAPVSPKSVKAALPANFDPAFHKRRISFEAFRSKAVPVVAPAAADGSAKACPAVVFRQDS